MKKTIEVTVGEKPEGEVDLTKCSSGSISSPQSDEVAGHYPYWGTFECWNDGTIFRAVADTDYYKWVRCPGCGAINKI